MRYQKLGRSGLRVSEICLGTMGFGTEWGYGSDKDESRRVFQTFLEAGGNFLDTANRYTEGTSERFLGEFVKESGRRDELVIASKYSLFTQPNRINDGGNHRKNLVQSVEGSLKRLQVDYLDVLWLHAWDFMTPEEEVMRALDDLVRAGKVLYLGVSDTPAWLAARCNTLAELRGWTAFVGLQVEYSLITRDAERDLLPMAEHLGLGATAWGPMAGGALTGKYLQKSDAGRLKPESKRLNARSVKITKAVVSVAEQIGCSPSHVALNWVRRRAIPIVGTRNASQLSDSLGCLNFALNERQLEKLDKASEFELGFPHDFLASENVRQVLFGGLQNQINPS
ncbi:MAG: aldo/keto reductase [Bacteroidetes bacterium]|nr:aldo/keto reductase [Bacteroidota bacterium]